MPSHKEYNKIHFWDHVFIGSIGLLAVGIAFGLSILLSGCKTAMPVIDITTWAGDSQNEAISRKQENKMIQCHEPEFDDFVCIHYSDLNKIYNAMLQCKQWGGPTMSSSELSKFLRKNQDVLRLFQAHASTK